jgi:hypothetical protein
MDVRLRDLLHRKLAGRCSQFLIDLKGPTRSVRGLNEKGSTKKAAQNHKHDLGIKTNTGKHTLVMLISIILIMIEMDRQMEIF